MDNKNKGSVAFKSFLLTISMLLVIMMVLFSCMSRKSYSHLDTERLFMQTAKPEIDFVGGGKLEGQSALRTISEEVSFTNDEEQHLEPGEEYASETAKLDTNKVYKLNEVVVKVKSHFAPERDGKVNVDFNVVAPIDVLDPNWRLIIAPKLIDGDSICALDTIIFTGDSFREKQQSDYEAYKDFLTTIVPRSAYDSLFVDWKGLNKEIVKVQKRNYNDYRSKYDLMMDYESWKRMNEREFLSVEALSMRHKHHMSEKYWRKAESLTDKRSLKGKEPVDFYKKYDKKYKNDYARFLKRSFALNWLDTVPYNLDIHSQKDSILKRRYVPRKFRDFYKNGLTLKDLQARAFTKEDSIKIAKHHYLIDEIVLNELNITRKGDIFKEMVEFPYRSDTSKIRLDSVITAENDMVYTFRQPWTVKPGMKKLKVFLETKAEAIDRTVFNFPPSDTLTYYVASLSQLAESSMATEKKKMYKFMFDRIVTYPKYKSKKIAKFDVAANPNVFDKLLEAYKTYSKESELSIDSVVIQTSVDLSGDWTSNSELCERRASSIRDYLKNKIPVHFVVKPKSEDWDTLAKEIQKNTHITNASEILNMLETAVYPDQTEKDIETRFPGDYKIIKEQIYPKLEHTDFVMEISRPDIKGDTIKETYREDYAEAVKLLIDGEYRPALEILANYLDYNTALCLTCMGYNDRAQSLLEKLPETAKNEYLAAILAARKNDDQKAAVHLIKACQLDPNLYHRVSLDTEVKGLADRLNLWERLSGSRAER